MLCIAVPAGQIPSACSTPTWRLRAEQGGLWRWPDGAINVTLTLQRQSCSSLCCTGIRSPRGVIDSHSTTWTEASEEPSTEPSRAQPRGARTVCGQSCGRSVTASTPFLAEGGFETVRYHHTDSPLKASLQAYCCLTGHAHKTSVRLLPDFDNLQWTLNNVRLHPRCQAMANIFLLILKWFGVGLSTTVTCVGGLQKKSVMNLRRA